MEIFLDDNIGAEVEVNPDEVEVLGKKKKPRKAQLLNKDEKKAVLDMLNDLAFNIVTKEDHIHVYKERDSCGSHYRVPNC